MQKKNKKKQKTNNNNKKSNHEAPRYTPVVSKNLGINECIMRFSSMQEVHGMAI